MSQIIEITIVVDHREPNSMVEDLKYLAETIGKFTQKKRKFKFKIEVGTLPTGQGDYIVKYLNMAFERKTIQDFFNSIKDGHIFYQLEAMCEEYEHPFLVISGNHNLYDEQLKAIYTTCADFILNHGLQIMTVKNDEFLAYFILMSVYKFYSTLKPHFRKRNRKTLTIADEQEYMLQGVKGWGRNLAVELLKRFKTPAKIATLSPQKISIFSLGNLDPPRLV